MIIASDTSIIYMRKGEGTMMNVKMGAKEVSLRKVQKDAENSYRGGFFCCEAVMDAIRNNFEIDVPKEVIGMASAMSIGAAVCAAL